MPTREEIDEGIAKLERFIDLSERMGEEGMASKGGKVVLAALRAEKARADLMERQYRELTEQVAAQKEHKAYYAAVLARHVAERAALGRDI